MKICFLAAATSIHTIKIVNMLSKYGYDVHLITQHPNRSEKLNINISIHKLMIKGPLGYYMNYFQLKKIIEEIQPDILHTNYASGYGTLARFINFDKKILSVWGSDVYIFPKRNKFNKSILVKNLSESHKIASTSNAMAEECRLNFDRERTIAITPFGIDIKKFCRQNYSNQNVITIGIVKSLKSVYGIDFMLRAIANTISTLNDRNELELAKKVKVMIVGDGPEKKKLYRLVKELGIEDEVEFLGRKLNKDIPNYLSKMDIYCAFSKSESFGVSILEASAVGIAVVANRVGGLQEVVQDGSTGYLIDSFNMNQATTSLLKLIKNDELRSIMGNNGRKMVELMYSEEVSLKSFIQLYKDTLKGDTD